MNVLPHDGKLIGPDELADGLEKDINNILEQIKIPYDFKADTKQWDRKTTLQLLNED